MFGKRKMWSNCRSEINYSNKLLSSRYACLDPAPDFFSGSVSENKRKAITSNKKNINEWKLRLMNRVIKIAGRRWDEIDSKENGSFLSPLILSFNFAPFFDCLTFNRDRCLVHVMNIFFIVVPHLNQSRCHPDDYDDSSMMNRKLAQRSAPMKKI